MVRGTHHVFTTEVAVDLFNSVDRCMNDFSPGNKAEDEKAVICPTILLKTV